MLAAAGRSDSCASDIDCRLKHCEMLSLLARGRLWDLFLLPAASWWMWSAVVVEDV